MCVCVCVRAHVWMHRYNVSCEHLCISRDKSISHIFITLHLVLCSQVFLYWWFVFLVRLVTCHFQSSSEAWSLHDPVPLTSLAGLEAGQPQSSSLYCIWALELKACREYLTHYMGAGSFWLCCAHSWLLSSISSSPKGKFAPKNRLRMIK